MQRRKSAEQVRRKFVQQLLARKTPPKGAALFVARHLADRSYELRYALEHGNSTAVELFGLTPATGWRGDIEAINKALDEVSEARAHVFTLGMVLAAAEGRLSTYGWKNVHAGTVAYFAFLVDQGYPLAEVEQVATGQDALPGTTTE